MGQGQGEEKKGKKGDNKVVLRVDMDCEACKQKVRKVLKHFPGVEDLELDMDEQKVTVKGNVDARKVYEALKKKCGNKRTTLVYPQFSKEDDEKAKQDSIMNSVSKIVDSITELLNPKPPDTAVELKVRMHCGGCAKKIKKILLRIDGVMEVDTDLTSDKVVVKGRGLDADTVCNGVRESGKHCEVVCVKKDADKTEKKKGEKNAEKIEVAKPEEKKDDKQEKKEEVKEEKQEGKQEKNKGGKKTQKKEEENGDEKKEGERDEGKKEEKEEGKKEGDKEAMKPKAGGNGGGGEVEVKKYVYPPYQSVPEYAYPPQIFSDENPNACSVM